MTRDEMLAIQLRNRLAMVAETEAKIKAEAEAAQRDVKTAEREVEQAQLALERAKGAARRQP